MTLLKRATIKSYDAGSHRAAVGISGSLSVWLDSLAISDSIPAAAVVAGRECAVLFHEDDNPDDAVIVSVHGGGPPGGGTPTLIEDADQDTKVQVEESADDDTIRFDTAGVERATLDASGRWVWSETFGHSFGIAGASPDVAFNYFTTGTVSASKTIWAVSPFLTVDAASKQFFAFQGNLLVTAANVSVTSLIGLSYGVLAAGTGDNPIFIDETAVLGSVGSFGTGAPTVIDITAIRGTDVGVGVNVAYTRYQGLWSDITGKSQATTMAGLRINDITAGTNKYLIWAGPNVPGAAGLTNLRLDAGNPPNAGLAAEGDSQLHLTFNENGVLAMRRLRHKTFATLAAGDRVAIAV